MALAFKYEIGRYENLTNVALSAVRATNSAAVGDTVVVFSVGISPDINNGVLLDSKGNSYSEIHQGGPIDGSNVSLDVYVYAAKITVQINPGDNLFRFIGCSYCISGGSGQYIRESSVGAPVISKPGYPWIGNYATGNPINYPGSITISFQPELWIAVYTYLRVVYNVTQSSVISSWVSSSSIITNGFTTQPMFVYRLFYVSGVGDSCYQEYVLNPCYILTSSSTGLLVSFSQSTYSAIASIAIQQNEPHYPNGIPGGTNHTTGNIDLLNITGACNCKPSAGIMDSVPPPVSAKDPLPASLSVTCDCNLP